MKAGNEKKPIVLVLAVIGLCLFFAVRGAKSPSAVQGKMQIGTEDRISVIPVQNRRNCLGIAMI